MDGCPGEWVGGQYPPTLPCCSREDMTLTAASLCLDTRESRYSQEPTPAPRTPQSAAPRILLCAQQSLEPEPRERPLPVSLLQPPAGPWMLSLAASWGSISSKDSPAAPAPGARWARDSEALAP